MPHTSKIAEQPTAEVLDDVMGRLHEFLSFVEQNESLQLLRALVDDIGQEISWAEAMSLQYSTLLANISTTATYELLKAIHEQLNTLEQERFLKTLSVASLHKNCTEYRDLLAGRAVELVAQEMTSSGRGAPPLAFALISMGSDGREEQTLITDQDYLIVYADGGGEHADNYFKSLAELLVERLAEIGFKKCTGDIMPSNPTWRGSLSQWNRRLLAIVRYEFEDYGKNLMDLIVLSDARFVAGDKELATTLTKTISGLQQDYFQVMWGMAKAATEMKLAIGFFETALDRRLRRTQGGVQPEASRLGAAGDECPDTSH